MNNHNPHNHNEQRPDERPFAYIPKSTATPAGQDQRHHAAQISHPGVPDHNRARINPDRTGMRCQHAECQEMRL